jgi:hypothetical protein
MIYVYDFIPFLAQAEGNPYLSDLFWVICDRLATFTGTQMGVYSLSSAERGMALTQRQFPVVNASVAGAALPQCMKVSSNRFCADARDLIFTTLD